MSDISLDVLDQGETWTDAQGVTHRIAQMEARYCRNVIAFLQRRADEITFVVGLNLCSMPLPSADAAFDAVSSSVDHELDRMASDPVAWLNDKPLIKALQQRADQGD